MGEVGLSYALGRVHFDIEYNHRKYNKKHNITCQRSLVLTSHKHTSIHTHMHTYVCVCVYIYMCVCAHAL